MKSVAQKIFITLGCITLMAMSVIPLHTEALGGPIVNPGAPAGATTKIDPTSTVASAIGTAIIASISPILYIVMRLIAGLLGLAGIILDGVIQMTVVQMAENFKKLTIINDLWKTIRDLGNITFIFILLYQGIRMVLGLSGANVKKAVTGIILAAILVNFSLLFTKVIIDASNIVTLGFYNSISSAGGGNKTIAGQNFNFGFSGAFMKPLGLSGILDVEGFKNLGNKDREASELIIYVGGSIFMLIAIFVFLAVALLFIIRYLAFILLLIMSPIAFLNFAIDLGSLSKKYWDTLFGQALFGPIYMFLTWIVLSIAGSDGFLNEAGSLGNTLANPNKDTIAVLVNFTLLIGLLIFSALQAKTFATKGGIVTSKLVDKGTGYVGGAVFGGAAALGRNTIGAAAYKMSNDTKLRERALSGDKFAQLQLKTLKGVSGSSFDARRSSVMETAQKKMDLDFGKGSLFNAKNTGDKGYAGKIERKEKEEATYVKSLKPTKEEEEVAKKEADATIASDAFKKEEEKRKGDFFKNPVYVSTLNATMKPLRDAVETSQKEKEANEDEIKSMESAVAETNKQLTALQNSILGTSSADRKAAQEKLKEQSGILAKLKETTKGKVEAFTKADAALKKAQEEETKKFNTWESDELKKLIAYSGGRRDDKNKENNIEAISKYQKLADEYAGVFEKRADSSLFTKAWNGNAVLNKSIAKKIRSDAKSKSDEQQLAEIIKKQAKEAKEAEEKTAKTEEPAKEEGGDKKETT